MTTRGAAAKTFASGGCSGLSLKSPVSGYETPAPRCAVSSKLAGSARREAKPQTTKTARSAATPARWRVNGSLVQVVRHARDDDLLAEEERPLDQERALIVQEMVPPARGYELRQENGHEVVGAFLVRDLDVLE